MTGSLTKFTLRLAPVALGIALVGAAVGAGEAGSSAGPLRCEIETASQNGMVSIAATVHADHVLDGSYSFRVKGAGGGGGSNISQGGSFSASPGMPAVLGRVMLGANSIYDATLQVEAGGLAVECEKRVGGAI